MIGVTKLSRGYSKECFHCQQARPIDGRNPQVMAYKTDVLHNSILAMRSTTISDSNYGAWSSSRDGLHLKTRMEKIRVVLFLQLNITRNSASALVKFKLVHSSVHCTRSALTEPELVTLVFASDSFECDNVCVLVAQTTGS